MKSIKHEFPNPVLASGRDDYIDSCNFSTKFDENAIKVTTDNIEIPISYSLQCNGLNQLIEEGKTAVIVDIKSSAASYRIVREFKQRETSTVIKIPKFHVVKKIELQSLIVAKTAIPNFCCPGEFNELYFKNSVFDIRKGDILAQEDARIIYVDDTELEKPISSIFNINRVPNQQENIIPEFDSESDKIEINLTESLFNLYMEFKDFNNGSLRRYITGIIVYPVLVEAISRICEYHQGINNVDYSDKRWFRAIEQKAEKLSSPLSDYCDAYTTLADKILGSVSVDALGSVKDTIDSEMNDGETQILGGVD